MAGPQVQPSSPDPAPSSLPSTKPGQAEAGQCHPGSVQYLRDGGEGARDPAPAWTSDVASSDVALLSHRVNLPEGREGMLGKAAGPGRGEPGHWGLLRDAGGNRGAGHLLSLGGGWGVGRSPTVTDEQTGLEGTTGCNAQCPVRGPPLFSVVNSFRQW